MIWLVYFLVVLGMAEVFNGEPTISKNPDPYFLHGFLDSYQGMPALARWDSVWYYEMSQHGYWGAAERSPYTAAFYPLYPALVFATQTVTGLNPWIAGILLSSVFLLGFLLCFEGYMDRVLKKTEPERNAALLLFLIFPATFIGLSFYHCSLFCFLVMATFLSVRLGKKKCALGLGFLAGLTHMHSLVLMLGLACFGFWGASKSKKLQNLLPAACVAAGTLVLMMHHYFYFDDFFSYVKAKSFFGAELKNPLHVISDLRDCLISIFKLHTLYSVDVFSRALIFMGTVVTSVYMWRKEDRHWRPEIVFMLSLCLLQVMTGSTWGFTRFALCLFPAFAFLGAKLSQRPLVLASFLIVGCFLQAAYLVKWITWYPPAP